MRNFQINILYMYIILYYVFLFDDVLRHFFFLKTWGYNSMYENEQLYRRCSIICIAIARSVMLKKGARG